MDKNRENCITKKLGNLTWRKKGLKREFVDLESTYWKKNTGQNVDRPNNIFLNKPFQCFFHSRHDGREMRSFHQLENDFALTLFL